MQIEEEPEKEDKVLDENPVVDETAIQLLQKEIQSSEWKKIICPL
jgi:hypothetical protein